MVEQIAKCFTLAVTVALANAGLVRAEELVIAFSLDTPPYVLDEGKRGIEIDIVRAVLAPQGYTFTVRQMPYAKLADAVKQEGVDAAATVTEMDDGTFYSDEYITFHNAAITKHSAQLKIDSIADLKGKTILAWENAYEDGSEVRVLFRRTSRRRTARSTTKSATRKSRWKSSGKPRMT